jgi:hypothetical protein
MIAEMAPRSFATRVDARNAAALNGAIASCTLILFRRVLAVSPSSFVISGANVRPGPRPSFIASNQAFRMSSAVNDSKSFVIAMCRSFVLPSPTHE